MGFSFWLLAMAIANGYGVSATDCFVSVIFAPGSSRDEMKYSEIMITVVQLEIVVFFLLCGVTIYFSHRKAEKHLELMSREDSRFMDAEDFVEVMRRSRKHLYLYVFVFYAHSPFYFYSAQDVNKTIENDIRRDSRAMWVCLVVIVILLVASG
jgi:hypothetical protein